MAGDESDLDRSLYSEGDFEYHLDEQEVGDIEESTAGSQKDAGKLKSTVMIRHVGLPDGEAASTSKGKGGLKGKSKNAGQEERDRCRSPLMVGRRVSFEESEAEKARDRRIVEDVTRNLRAEITAMMEQVRPRENPAVEELDRLKVEQRTNSLMAKGALLSSDGAKAQYLAFARVKAGAEEVRRKIAAGDGLAATEALDRLEKVVDLRLETITRADNSPGGWSVATVFERMAFEADANQPKLDRYWKAAAAQVEEKKESRKISARGRPAERGRRKYLFRSVGYSIFPLYFLCRFLASFRQYMPVI